MKIAAVYIRCAAGAESVMERQVRRCFAVAGQNSLSVAPALIFQDCGASGRRVGRHPGFKAMMAALSAGEADVLVVEDVSSRLSRAVPELLSVLSELAEKSIQVLTAEGPSLPILFR